MVAPVGPALADTGKGTAAMLVFISDPGQQLVSDLAILKELFDFPRRRPGSSSPCSTASRRRTSPDRWVLSYHTVRTLLARAMDRTDTRS
jgi:hypothetical protein